MVIAEADLGAWKFVILVYMFLLVRLCSHIPRVDLVHIHSIAQFCLLSPLFSPSISCPSHLLKISLLFPIVCLSF